MHSFARHLLASALLLVPISATQAADTWVEYEKRVDTEQRLTALGTDLLGDSIDPNTGQITFDHTDIVLPGNSKLDVSLRRRVTQSYLYDEGVNAEFGNWQYVVPRMTVITRSIEAGGWTGNRCTNSFSQTGFPRIVKVGSNPVEYLYAGDYSNGLQLEVPGQGPQQVLASNGGPGWPTGTKFVTAQNWAFTCITAYTASGAVDGQGMLGYAPDGTRYKFDRYIIHSYRKLGVMLASKSVGTPRAKAILAATEVTDVNGNWVKYDYDSLGRLTKIHSNDGRRIDLTYQGTSKLVSQAIANPGAAQRIWTYGYRNTWQSKPYWEGGTAINTQSLGSVTQPDGRAWTLELDGMFAEPTPGECYTWANALHVTHPYGVVGTFWLEEKRHRMGLYDMMEILWDCPTGEPSPPPSENPQWGTMLYDTMSVTSKKLEGPGITTAEWLFDYEMDTAPSGQDSFPPHNVPARTNWTTVKLVEGGVVQSETKYYHRFQYDSMTGLFGGALLKKEIRQAPGADPLEVTEYKDSGTGSGADGIPNYTIEPSMGSPLASLTSIMSVVKVLPDRVVISRGPSASQYDTFTTDYAYDTNVNSAGYSFGKATLVTETSSTAPTLSRVTINTYLHNKTQWVVGLIDTVTRNGKLFDDFGYDSLGRLTTHRRFDSLATPSATYTYSIVAGEVGAIATITDALSNVYTLSNWKRGKPQTVRRPGTPLDFLRVVDDNGWVTSETDSRGVTTGFGYNSMGWLTSVDRPSPHADTTVAYSGYGTNLQAVHTRGTQRTTVAYDGMLRAAQVKKDATDGSVDAMYERIAYDIEGRTTFKARPSFNSAPPDYGIQTKYDALGRVTETADSVAPTVVKTTIAYLQNGLTQTTDPSGAVVSTTSRSFGTPSNPEITQVVDAMGGVTVTSRDIYGNVQTLTQSGTQYGYTASATRQFWYDSRLRLCRHRAPEFGDELFEYYDNDKLRYSSRGETPATGCASTSPSLRTELTYDGRGRLTNTNFADASPDIVVGYDGESNRLSVTRGATAWTYDYNDLGQLKWEQLVVDARTYRFDYGYNSNDHLNTRTRQGGTSVSYVPDGLGRPRKVSVGGTDYIHSVSYTPNGLVASGTLNNGHVLTQTLDTYQRPWELTVAKVGGPTAISRTHLYDVRSQLETLTDHVTAAESRVFDYDAKGRLMTATGPWGSGSFKYDALDNLRQQALGSRLIDVAYDAATNRVTSATDAGAPRSYAYDSRGNATTVGTMSFTYDFSNQPTAVLGTAVALYTYDGHLKRVKSLANGKLSYWVYPSAGGSVSFQDNITEAKAIDYLAIGPLAVRLTNGSSPEYTHSDLLGSPVAATDAAGTVTWRESYNPYGETGIKPLANANNTGYTGHVQDDYSGLTYMQARYYDPIIGRFLSTDPIGYQDQLNLYAYVGNDPVNKFDPTGMEESKLEDPQRPGSGKAPDQNRGKPPEQSRASWTGSVSYTVQVAAQSPSSTIEFSNAKQSSGGDASGETNGPSDAAPLEQVTVADAQEGAAESPSQPDTDPNVYNYFNWKGDRVIGVVIDSLGRVTDTNSFDRSTLESLGGASSIPGSDYEFYEWEEDTYRSGDEGP